jgi:ABC-type methionine transport system ATPase subunit
MLKTPKILLLDEATSALDADSESIVQEALDRLMVGRMTVIVAHRLSTISNVNMIVVIQQGQVVETGKIKCLHAIFTWYETMDMNGGCGDNNLSLNYITWWCLVWLFELAVHIAYFIHVHNITL